MNFNLAVILRETADASPGKAVAVYAGGQLAYRELDALSDRLAVGLEAAGLRPGDAVALQLPNIWQFLVAYFGILKAGGMAVPLNVLLKAPEVAFYLGDSGAKILITLEGALGDAAGVSEIYAVGHAEAAPGAHPFERLLAVADGPPARPADADRHRGHHLHLRHDRPSQGGRADPYAAVHERRHPGPPGWRAAR